MMYSWENIWIRIRIIVVTGHGTIESFSVGPAVSPKKVDYCMFIERHTYNVPVPYMQTVITCMDWIFIFGL